MMGEQLETYSGTNLWIQPAKQIELCVLTTLYIGPWIAETLVGAQFSAWYAVGQTRVAKPQTWGCRFLGVIFHSH